MSLNANHWIAPATLNHTTWQTAKTECVRAIQAAVHAHGHSKELCVFTLNWQSCTVVDSSALAFILALKKQFVAPLVFQHQHVPIALKQLAQLYEVTDIINI